jgi:GGDEF domain-containing protein
MSQMDKDPVTMELQVAAVFDSGQYASVRLIDPNGKAMVEKSGPPVPGDAPEWFIGLFPIASQPGHAQVSTGWNQFGTLELVSHSHFAYEELWQGAVKLLAWFALGGSLMGLLGMQLLRRIKRPLDAVVGQAQAISERRFIGIPVPATPELKSLASAMNAMVDRLKAMFAEEAARLEQVRREANLDNLTGLSNRNFFMNQLAAALSDDDAVPAGSLIMLRLADLAGINRRAGRETADELLRRVGLALNEQANDKPNAVAARLNGADFALLLPGINDPAPTAEKLLHALNAWPPPAWSMAIVSAIWPAAAICTVTPSPTCCPVSMQPSPRRKPRAAWPGAEPRATMTSAPTPTPIGKNCSMAPSRLSACA